MKTKRLIHSCWPCRQHPQSKAGTGIKQEIEVFKCIDKIYFIMHWRFITDWVLNGSCAFVSYLFSCVHSSPLSRLIQLYRTYKEPVLHLPGVLKTLWDGQSLDSNSVSNDLIYLIIKFILIRFSIFHLTDISALKLKGTVPLHKIKLFLSLDAFLLNFSTHPYFSYLFSVFPTSLILVIHVYTLDLLNYEAKQFHV